MKRLCWIAASVLVLACSPDGSAPGETSTAAQESDMAKPESMLDRASYGIGFNLGSTLSEQGIEANVDLLSRGIRDGLNGSESLLEQAEIQAALTELQSVVETAMEEKMSRAAETNLAEGIAFLETNGQRPEVQTTASGLQYEVLVTGEGSKPSSTDTVSVHYKGTLLDGTVFDSSYDRGQPATFPLNRVIPGWTEGLQLMTVGSKYKLFIPSELGYGAQGAGQDIGPNATLVFEVELLEIAQ